MYVSIVWIPYLRCEIIANDQAHLSSFVTQPTLHSDDETGGEKIAGGQKL